MGKFSDQVGGWAAAQKLRMKAVRDGAVQEFCEIANEPQSSGGHMPIDTGFLRASFTGYRGHVKLPVIKTPKPKEGQKVVHTFDALPVGALLVETPLGESITIGWSANYARYMNYRYQFLGLAVQLWPQLVKKHERLTAAYVIRQGRGLQPRRDF